MSKPGAKTLHIPSGDEMDVFDAARRYGEEGTPVVILAGKDYGSGSSRDWAAKGPWIQGVRAVLAESFERIHRSNLVGMGIVPLQFHDGENSSTYNLNGREKYTVELPDVLTPGMDITVMTDNGVAIKTRLRFDTDVELTYFKHGGILNYMIRSLI